MTVLSVLGTLAGRALSLLTLGGVLLLAAAVVRGRLYDRRQQREDVATVHYLAARLTDPPRPEFVAGLRDRVVREARDVRGGQQ